MKTILLLLLFWSSMATACILPPTIEKPTAELGFEFRESSSSLCKDCNQISILAPKNFNDRPISHAIFSVYLHDDLVTKSVIRLDESRSKAEFYSIVSNKNGMAYRVQVEYGHGRCMSYRFDFTGPVSDSSQPDE